MPDWCILQVFLSPRRIAVYEVQIELTTRNLCCTCPNNSGNRTCRHVKFVRARMARNGGSYPLRVHATSVAEYTASEGDPNTYRTFMLNHAHIEVL